MEFHDPRADPSAPVEAYALSIDLTRGPVAIGLLANGFPDSVAFLERVEEALRPFGERCEATHRGGASVLLEGGESQLADVVRALDAAGIAIEQLQLHAPSLDDVFLAKTGRSLEGAEEDEAESEDAAAEKAPA